MSNNTYNDQKSDKVALAVLEFLRKNPNLYFQFTYLKNSYGKINPIREDGNLVIPTEFREGYLVKNYLRQLQFCKEWTEEDIKNHWTKKVNLAMVYDDGENIFDQGD